MKRSTIVVISAAFAAACCTSTASFAAGGNLVLNGKVASTSLRTIEGSPYVKLSDIAKALGMVVTRRPGGYEIAAAGGANQVNGMLQGKLGDQLFDGRWRFKVVSTDTAQSYTTKSQAEPYDYGSDTNYNTVTRTFTPKSGFELLIVDCVAANGQKTKQTLWVSPSGSNTAVTDDQGHSYTPILHDFTGAPQQTQALLPGAKINFPLLFCVPTGAKIQDLVFTLRNNDSSLPAHDVRVSLAK